ncbi:MULTISPECIES: hypothetical protein [unclassified Lentimonas]|uniref:hypothetical protein n=1 Tax=unclassified Lentimonas TaxID=2630993 RepID=UPI001329BEE3|nr:MULTISPECIES: hypothetical protein [unclassified Lentimonas]CAA6692410.1 Unannotated [Lentimonas sp. CC19]CAA6693997.1 Unannotated [Lentimonas sp. CC10]CAA7072228.1 Unannotated [Lentimonas sp. CC11]
MKKIICSLCITVLASYASAADSFTVDLNGIRNAVATTVAGQAALFVSESTGSVACYTTEGQELWKRSTVEPAIMFEIEAADLDGDGQDEMLAVSANGNLYCWSNDGAIRWVFNPGHKVRFSEVAVAHEGVKARVFVGGNDFVLYELDSKGQLTSKTKIEGTVRKIEAGDFIEDGKDALFLQTYSHDKFGWAFMGFIDPVSKKVLKDAGKSSSLSKDWKNFMLSDVKVDDIDGDGRDDLLVFGAPKTSLAGFMAWNGELKEIASFWGDKKDKQRYAHTIGTSLLPTRKEIVMQYGGLLYVCDLKGKLLHRSGIKHRGVIFNNLTSVPETGELFGVAQVGGGNSMYRYDLSAANWWEHTHELQGRLAEVEQNMQTLYEQALTFERPAYQKKSDEPWVMIANVDCSEEVDKKEGEDLIFVTQYTWHENFDRSGLVEILGDVALQQDRRGDYKDTREEMVAIAKDHEARGEPFTVWTGHSNDPFYVSIETMEALLEVAPNTCYGFIYAEMSNPEDVRYHHFIDSYMPRLAKACRKNGKAKLYFRYKNVFWAASSHLEPWNRLFFSGKYSDILVPSSEDTNSRTQDINFAGRVGMLTAGYVDNMAMRLVDDNPTSWRPLSSGSVRTTSPYLRNGVILAGYGARSGILFDISYLEEPGYNTLFALMKAGVLPEVKSENILSIGSWLLIQDVDEKLVHEIDDGHNMELYAPTDEDAVFSVGSVSWCGASVPAHDFSKMLGVDYRWLNFVPEMPNGMVPVAPISYAKTLDAQGVPYAVSDGRVGFVDGNKVPAKQFGPLLNDTVQAGAKQMPILVSGASWSAVKLDDHHVRLILVDPGYVDPQERDVIVRFQGECPESATDILSKESLPITSHTIELTVPAGSVRFVDVSYKQSL